jgi:hypothetical protein
MTSAELLSTLLPISDGRFSVSLVPSEQGVTLAYRGVEQTGSWWSPGLEQELDTTFTCELPETVDERLDLVLRTWADVMREAVTALAKSERPSLSVRDVLDPKVVRELVAAKKLVTETELRQRWRWRLAASLPFQPELEAAELAIKEHFEKEGSTIASGESEKGVTSLEFVNTERRNGALNVVVRLITWDRKGDELVIRDVKEQEVVFLSAGPGLEPSRITAFLMALHECLSLSLVKVDAEVLMPHDLIISPQDYKSGATVDDFRKLLRRKLKLDEKE